MDVCTAASRGRTKRRVGKKNRSWHRRLHLRKTAVQPPAMQGRDKSGPKEIAKKWERSGAWPPSREPPQEARVTGDAGASLRFPCSRCEDSSEYAPKDLVRHFAEKHRGSPPVFSCHMCAFSAHEFSYLQVHLLSHEDTFSSCSMCNDNVQRTWPEFSAHLTRHHCSDGEYSCGTCEKFSTCDFGVFLEHICKHNLGVEEVDAHQLSAAQSACCQLCGFEVPEKWSINKHVRAAHVCQNGNQRKDWRQAHSVAMKPNDPIPRAETRLTRSTVRDTCWLTQDCLSLPGKEFLDKYCRLSDPKATLEETQQFLMQTVAGETDDQKWTKALKSVLSNVPQRNPENGVPPAASDLGVLTVKNKITVAQNAAAYAKRLTTASADKEAACPESTDADSNRASDPRTFNQKLKNQTPQPGGDSSAAGTQRNHENHKLETDSESQEHWQKMEEPKDTLSCKSSDERTSAGGAQTRGKTRKRSRRRKVRSKKVQRRSEGEAVKMVLEKNVANGETNGRLEPADSLEQSRGPEGVPAGNEPELPQSSPSTRKGIQQKSADFSNKSRPAEGTSEAGATSPRGTATLQNAHRGADGETETAASPAAVDEGLNSDSCPVRSAEQSDGVVEGSRSEGAPADSGPDLRAGVRSPQGETSGQEHSPAAGRPLQPVSKHQQRTLRLVAMNPSQPVKRPAGDQPVVVLNHPDAEIPQVARIMEVVNKYREVRKVLLSRRTLRALSGLGGEAAESDALADDRGRSSVKERFTLRLKFRRLTRKRYEIVGVASPGCEVASRFSCWFCGRVFSNQEEMMIHRQRHLMEWKKPNCERS